MCNIRMSRYGMGKNERGGGGGGGEETVSE